MLDIKKVVKQGFMDGVHTTWELAKVIVPVFFLITFLQHTPAIDWMVKICEPLTSLVGLPGEAALPIVIANTLTVYPAIPAIVAFPFTAKQITVIAIMILISHSLPVEGVVAKKAGVGILKISIIRIVSAIMAGFVINLIL